MVSKVYKISELEKDALLYMYYSMLWTFDNGKGLAYRNSFKFRQSLNKVIDDLVKHHINVSDYIIVSNDV